MSEAAPPGPGSPPESSEAFSLANHFLIAMPGMADPSFSGTVVFLCEHSSRGALGVVINRPTDLTLQTLFERVELKFEDEPRSSEPVLYGGPVHTDRGFVLHTQADAHYDSTLRVNDSVALTMSRDVLEAVAEGDGPPKLLVTLGHAGWGEGQLEYEIGRNAWLTVPADLSVIFDTPAQQRFGAAMHLLGIDPAMLSDQAGHA
jgi:putative transcriptional regulator